MSRMRIAPVLLCLALPAAAVELNASLALAPELDSARRGSPWSAGQPAAMPERSARQELELRLRQGGLNTQGTLRWLAAEGTTPAYRGVLNQAYYDGEIGGGLGWTVGKKVLSWGVGFGFRPLDLVQREDRRGVNLPALVGVPLLAFERYTADQAWTLAWTHPGGGDPRSDSRDASLALHWYRLLDGNDLHAVARTSARRGLEAGLGATRVVGEEWSFHGAVLYARHGRRLVNSLTENGGLLAAADPMAETVDRGSLKAVAGAQWTGESGWSVLAEAWYDGDAYTRADWQRLAALTAAQQTSGAPETAIAANTAWSGQAYSAPDLLRENLLMRLAHDDRDGFKPYAELLLTPRDRGAVLTLGASIEGDRQRLAFGLRELGGARDSAYASAPVQRMLWAEWRIAMF